MEKELREKLEEMQKEIDRENEVIHCSRKISFLAGRDHAVNEMDDFLDALDDGWHDLREKPEDLPGNFRNLYVTCGGLVGEGYYNMVDREWHVDFNDNNVIGWCEANKPMFAPDRFGVK